jgi:hypothetical protein
LHMKKKKIPMRKNNLQQNRNSNPHFGAVNDPISQIYLLHDTVKTPKIYHNKVSQLSIILRIFIHRSAPLRIYGDKIA